LEVFTSSAIGLGLMAAVTRYGPPSNPLHYTNPAAMLAGVVLGAVAGASGLLLWQRIHRGVKDQDGAFSDLACDPKLDNSSTRIVSAPSIVAPAEAVAPHGTQKQRFNGKEKAAQEAESSYSQTLKNERMKVDLRLGHTSVSHQPYA
jgi:hypothetical protein